MIAIITDFLDSWSLFAEQYITGLILALLLAQIGVLIVAEDRVFLGAAVAQASTLGIAIAMIFGEGIAHAMGSIMGEESAEHLLREFAAVLFAIAAALFTARARQPGRDSREAMTAWVFLIASSLSVLLLSQSPHGREEIDKLLTSTIIGAQWSDVWLFALITIVTTVILLFSHRKLTLMVMDEETSAALGLRVNRWRIGTSIALGLVLGLAMHVGGLLFTFGCLVLPGMIARNLCRRVAPMFLVAPILCVLATLAGLILADANDFPPGQAVVALLAILLIPAWFVRR